jgi:predicted transcriptional regulator YheO
MVCINFSVSLFACFAAQVPLYMVSGTPIPVPKMDKADTEKFNKAVDEVHDKVVKQLQELYDRHKASYGERHQLVFAG